MMTDPDPNVVKELLSELRDVSKEKRRTAVMKLGMLGGDVAVRTLITLLLNDNEDLIVRGRSALMLGKLKDQRAVDALIRALRAPGHQTPVHAAEALGNIGDRRAIPHLLALLNETTSGKDKARDAALVALHKLGYDPNAPEAKQADPVLEM